MSQPVNQPMNPSQSRDLNLADIQGNVLSAYGKLGFPRARYVFLHVAQEEAGRALITGLLPRITTALRWKSRKEYPGEVIEQRPVVAWNLAFTWRGLLALGLPTITLRAMPPEFIDGMAARGHVLGDRPEREQNEVQPRVPAHWDAIWRNSAGEGQVHIMVSLNAAHDAPPDALDRAFDDLVARCQQLGNGVRVLPGHGPGQAPYQDAGVLRNGGQFLKSEHFGFADGIGDPVFSGQYPAEVIAEKAVGQGKLLPDQSWAPLATGEFLLGYVDEAQEVPGQIYPFEFTRNGTFMAYRKLHENVGSFRRYLDETARTYARTMGLPDTPAGFDEARQTLLAKLSGRWPADGVPLSAAPTWAEYKAFQAREQAARASGDAPAIARIERAYVDFTYRDDPAGTKCPVTAHMRRANPRDMLDPNVHSASAKDWNGSVLNNRRRILRRGLPYGVSDSTSEDGDEQGIVFMAVCASLFRQFEFVQQQWMQYGLDFNAGNDTCPLTGNQGPESKFVIPADPASGKPPFVCGKLPQLVETRGGDYFFVPSMTGLRMLGLGIVDPT